MSLQAYAVSTLVFPDARLATRWTAGLAVLIVAFLFSSLVPMSRLPDAVGTAMYVGVFFAVVGAIICRYRVVSSPVERA